MLMHALQLQKPHPPADFCCSPAPVPQAGHAPLVMLPIPCTTLGQAPAPHVNLVLFSQFKGEMGELEELRELKEDVERRERAQATVIESQAKRLDQVRTSCAACAL